MKIVFIYEHFKPPFDEGVKKFVKAIYDHMAYRHSVALVRNLCGVPGAINKLILLPRVAIACMCHNPDRVLYVPEGALTFASIFRIWLLRTLLRERLLVIGVQRRTLRGWQQWIARRLALGTVYVMSSAMVADLRQIGVNAKVLDVGIDRSRYAPVEDFLPLRKKYGLCEDRPVLLHVGHIKESRNVRWLMNIRRALPDIQIVLVGSTSTVQDGALGEELAHAGVVMMREYVPEIQEIYQLATWYLFPVMMEDGAMEIPLSVLESMAVNLPVISTRFGRLPELFDEDACYRYVSASGDVVRLLREGFGRNCQNRHKTEPFSWEATVNTLLGAEMP